MDKTLVGLIAAIGALTPLSAAKADVSPADFRSAMEATSYGELLRPIANAAAILKVADQQNTVSPDASVQLVQYHHHHHHHHHYRRHYHHHHHHHHYY